MTFKQKIRKNIEASVEYLQRFTDRFWYPQIIGFLALLDAFILVIPVDGILISSVLLKPKRWIYLSTCVTIGSTIGALMFFYFVEKHGLPFILDIYPNINQGQIWNWSEVFFQKYGLLLVFFVAATPLFQHPTIILASLAHAPFPHMLAVVFSGRVIKYFIMAYLSSHSPRLLSKLWGVQAELDEVGIHIGSKIHKPK